MPSFIYFTNHIYICTDIQIIQFALAHCDSKVFFLLSRAELQAAVVRQGNFATPKTRYQYTLSTKNYTLNLYSVSPLSNDLLGLDLGHIFCKKQHLNYAAKVTGCLQFCIKQLFLNCASRD